MRHSENCREWNLSEAQRGIRWLVAGYFGLLGPIVVLGWLFLDALGSVQAGMSDGPRGVRGSDRYFCWSVSLYCLSGVFAGCMRSASARLCLAFMAHLAIIVGGCLRTDDLEAGIVSGVVLCGLLAAPFGWAWFVLVKDWFRESV